MSTILEDFWKEDVFLEPQAWRVWKMQVHIILLFKYLLQLNITYSVDIYT